MVLFEQSKSMVEKMALVKIHDALNLVLRGGSKFDLCRQIENCLKTRSSRHDFLLIYKRYRASMTFQIEPDNDSFSELMENMNASWYRDRNLLLP